MTTSTPASGKPTSTDDPVVQPDGGKPTPASEPATTNGGKPTPADEPAK